jgi:serine phosphatase RsbU (regulator of sigma subunit)
VPQTVPPDQIGDRIESLQEAFRKLSKVSTLRDLAGQFGAVARGMFPTFNVGVFYRSGDSSDWQPLSPGEMKDAAILLGGHSRDAGSLCAVREAPGGVSIVQRLVDKSSVGIVLVGKPELSAVPLPDAVTLRLIAHLFDTAYQEFLSRRNEKELIFSLNHRVLQLNSLIDTGIEVSKLDQDASPQQLALERAASLTNASKGIVRVLRGEQVKEVITFPAGLTTDELSGRDRRIGTRFTFAGDTYTFELFAKESRSGIVPFDETDQLLLDALARQVHASLENRYLHRQALEKQRMEQDLAVAASIQQRILPASLPALEGYDIAGVNIPSKSVGGDYYDCIPLSNGKYALVIADVAGKGIPAALLVSSLHAYLQAYLEGTMPLVELVRRLNRVIYTASTDDKFITAFVAILTPETGEVESVNAGHNPAYWLKSDNSIQELNAGGIALGMLDIDFPFQSEHFTIGKGERLLLYTDGIPEATNEHQVLYDTHVPLQQFVLRVRPERAEKFIQELILDIKNFTGNAPQSDDITALYLLRH